MVYLASIALKETMGTSTLFSAIEVLYRQGMRRPISIPGHEPPSAITGPNDLGESDSFAGVLLRIVLRSYFDTAQELVN